MTGLDSEHAEAGEYVIGLLSANERSAFEQRLKSENRLVQLVQEWEEKLAPLNAEYVGKVPPDRVKAAIDRRLFGTGTQKIRVWLRLSFWSAAVATLLAFFVVMAGIEVALNRPELIAELSPVEPGYRFQAGYDAQSNALTVRAVQIRVHDDRVFELWAIGDDGVPMSLGVLPADGEYEVRPELPMVKGVTLAISLEPIGGSPTGAPTGPVLSAGSLSDV